MPRFLSPEWVTAFNRALDGADLAAVDTTGSLAAAGGTFRVAQVVHGVPGEPGASGEVRTLLTVAEGVARLERQGANGADDAGPGADVTVSLSYPDAVALSQGALDPAAALGAGRVRVRGDLSVLVAGQALLAAAARRLADLHVDTTY
jgi:hypothetical protein